jgi:hypothetical protein
MKPFATVVVFGHQADRRHLQPPGKLKLGCLSGRLETGTLDALVTGHLIWRAGGQPRCEDCDERRAVGVSRAVHGRLALSPFLAEALGLGRDGALFVITLVVDLSTGDSLAWYAWLINLAQLLLLVLPETRRFFARQVVPA